MSVSTVPPVRPSTGFVRSLIGGVPTLAVLAALGVAAWWGHSHGWRLPKEVAEASGDAWCSAHSVPEAICVECDAKLMPKPPSFGWCKIHGIPECPHCHPELAQVNGPIAKPEYDPLAAMSLLPRTANDPACKLHERRIQLASDAAAKKAGLDIDFVSALPMGEYITAYGEVVFDPSRVARLSSPVPGRVAWVAKDLGQTVAAGELIAVVDSTTIGKAKTDLLQAVAQRTFRARSLETLKSAGSTIPELRLREAEAALAEADVHVLSAEQTLANYGLAVSATSLASLTPTDAAMRMRTLGLPETLPEALRSSANLLPIRAAMAGTIVTRDAVAGEVVDGTKTLFVVADPSQMLLTLQVREEDAKHIRPGLAVQFDDAKGSRLAAGVIEALSPTIDDKTRTLPVRVRLANSEGKLRNNTFGNGRVVLREEPKAIVVPNSAIHWDGTCNIVFVRDRNYYAPNGYKVFHVRKVVPGARNETHTELLAGVVPGEVVAAKGSAALRAELLKANMGDGCGCGH